jgi:hypothetical protein
MSQKHSDYRVVAGEVRLPAPLSYYAVSPAGDVIGYWRGRVFLTGSPDKDGYIRFTLIRDDGTRTYPRRPQLICSAFHGPCPEGMEVRHLNGLSTDDRSDNLCWGTHQENIDDRERHRSMRRAVAMGASL